MWHITGFVLTANINIKTHQPPHFLLQVFLPHRHVCFGWCCCWYGKHPCICSVLYILGGAEFLPSTVWASYKHLFQFNHLHTDWMIPMLPISPPRVAGGALDEAAIPTANIEVAWPWDVLKEGGKWIRIEQWSKPPFVAAGNYTTQFYRNCKKPLKGSLWTNQYNGMSRTGFEHCSICHHEKGSIRFILFFYH